MYEADNKLLPQKSDSWNVALMHIPLWFYK